MVTGFPARIAKPLTSFHSWLPEANLTTTGAESPDVLNATSTLMVAWFYVRHAFVAHLLSGWCVIVNSNRHAHHLMSPSR